MFKRISPLTITGIIIIIVSLVSSPFIFGNWYVFSILGSLFGLLLVALDFIYTQRKIGNKIFDPRLFVFVKIIIIGFIALIINAVILMSYFGSNAGFFTDFVCLIFYIPGILIGACIFLILLRTPAAKYIESKKMRYFYVIFAILIVILPIIFGWSMLSPTYQGRQPVTTVKLSFDGSRLFSISGGQSIVSNQDKGRDIVYDYIVWNTSSGNIIWNETIRNSYLNSYSSDASRYTAISPNGEYLVGYRNIISIQSKQTIAYYTGRFIDWSENNDKFVTTDDHSLIYIYNATNFSLIRTFSYKPDKVTISPNGENLAVILSSGTNNENVNLSIINITTGDVINLYNYIQHGHQDEYLSWSKDETQLQMVRSVFKPFNISDHTRDYSLTIWNITDSRIVHNLSFTTEYKDLGDTRVLYCVFGKYIIYDNDYHTSKLLIYNLTGLQTQFNMGSRIFDISYDGTKMALGSDAVQIRNATTGELINTLQPPQYELIRPIPGFEFVALLCAISLILFVRCRKKK